MSNLSVYRPSGLYTHRENYLRYLESREWADRKRAYWSSDRPHRCWVCDKPWTLNAKGFNFHHVSYANLYQEPIDDLVLLCREHHEAIEVQWKIWKPTGITLELMTYMEICNLRVAAGRSLDTLMPFFKELID